MRIEQVERLQVGSDMIGVNQLVRITTENGLVGIGQSGTWGFPDAVDAVLAGYADYLIGQDPFRTEHIQASLQRLRPFRGNVMWGALSAIDLALWDIKGKHFGVPVWELLGGRYRDRVRLHLLLEHVEPDTLEAACRKGAEAGFTAIKFDPFRAGWEDATLPRLIADARDMAAIARETVGPDVDLIFELHRKLTPAQSVPVVDALAEFQPLFVEDPIQIDSTELQAELARRYRVPLATGERMTSLQEFRDLFAAGGPQHVRPDLGMGGGFTGCRKIAALAEAHHSALVAHNFLGPLLTAASVHLAVSIPNFLTQEYTLFDESKRPPDALFRSTLVREGGDLLAPEAPGLGVELDEALLAQAPPRPLGTTSLERKDGSPANAL
jgi:galactonate dehydratase